MQRLGQIRMKKINSQLGYIALSVVLILIAVILAIATTVALLSIGESQSGLALFKGEDTLTFVEGCVEDYMLKIRSQGGSFVASNITRPEGTCTITVTTGDPNWNITVSTLATAYKRQIQVIFVRNSTGITLTSWKEI